MTSLELSVIGQTDEIIPRGHPTSTLVRCCVLGVIVRNEYILSAGSRGDAHRGEDGRGFTMSWYSLGYSNISVGSSYSGPRDLVDRGVHPVPYVTTNWIRTCSIFVNIHQVRALSCAPASTDAGLGISTGRLPVGSDP